MKFIVISDIHGRDDLVQKVISMHRNADGILVLGDGVRDIGFSECTEGGRFFAGVRGNCDGLFSSFGEYSYFDELLLTLGEYNVIMMHGHKHSVKSGVEPAAVYASKRGADILLYGHTHIPTEKYYAEGSEIDGYVMPRALRVMNPGSLGCSQDGTHSFGLMQIKGDSVLFSHGTVK